MPQENVRWMVELRLGIREEQAERLMDSSGIRSTLTQHSYRGAHQATQLSGPCRLPAHEKQAQLSPVVFPSALPAKGITSKCTL